MASKTNISLSIKMTIVDIMKKILQYQGEDKVSLFDHQLYAEEKFLREQLSGRTRA